MDYDNRVAPPIPFVYRFCLQNLRCHMCCRAIKTKLIGVAASAYQCLLLKQARSYLDGTKDERMSLAELLL